MVGSLPLSFSLSSSQLRLVAALGMGVLVGTSLIVIIPEGVETLYSSTSRSPTSHNHRRGLAEQAVDVRWGEHVGVPSSVLDGVGYGESNSPTPVAIEDSDLGSPLTSKGIKERRKEEKEASKDDGKPKDDDDDDDEKEKAEAEDDEEKKDEKEQKSPHAWIGVGLISGFLLMYLIDQLPHFATSSSKQQRPPYHISLDNLSSGLGRGPSPAPRSGLLDFGGSRSSSKTGQGFATTMGLVIHAAADGIALAASTSSTGLSFIIFTAIMVHKAPASFGLTTALLKQGLSSRAIRTHLVVFSLAAPVGAIMTWVVAHTLMAGHVGDERSTQWRTGMLLLFSAGTFLYVFFFFLK